MSWIFDKPQPKTAKKMPLFDTCKIEGLQEVSGLTKKAIMDAVKLGSYEEIAKIKTENIVIPEGVEKLDGAIFKAYETKFGSVNENGEIYDRDCLDEFIQNYYVKNGLNMPVTIQHRDDLTHLVGRVLLIEVNSVGFYFICYIPRTDPRYEEIVNKIKAGILQGLSKEGWADEWENHFNKETGYWESMTIKKMRITAMSIVATPANGVAFEKAQEIKNALIYRKETPKDKGETRMFN